MPRKPSQWVEIMREKAIELLSEHDSICIEDLREADAKLRLQGIERPHNSSWNVVFYDRRFQYSHDRFVTRMVGRRRDTRVVRCYKLVPPGGVTWNGIPPFNVKCRTAGRYNV